MRRTLSLLTILLTVACNTTTGNRQPATGQPATRQPLFGPHGFDLTGMDPTVKACDCTDADKMVREESKRCAIW